MKTIARVVVASLVVVGIAASSQAKSPRSFVNQVVQSTRGQADLTRQIRQVVEGRHFGGGGHGRAKPGCVLPPVRPVLPGPPCGGGYCPPERPPVCFVYIVYYYDCHCGWKTYGTYHRHFEAQYAVQRLQNQGYRAYFRRVAR